MNDMIVETSLKKKKEKKKKPTCVQNNQMYSSIKPLSKAFIVEVINLFCVFFFFFFLINLFFIYVRI